LASVSFPSLGREIAMPLQLWQYAKLHFANWCCQDEATFSWEADNRLIITASVAADMHAKAALGVEQGAI
jgi:hypothetical protein